MKIIGIAGKARSGKNTVAKLWQQTDTIDWEIIAFGDKLKEVCATLVSEPVEYFHDDILKSQLIPNWNITRRELMQVLGTDAIRNNFNPNVWVQSLEYQLDYSKNYLIPDVRFPNEYEMIKAHGGIVINVTSAKSIQFDHISENLLDNMHFDYYINNDSTIDELSAKVDEIMSYYYGN